jgi:plastocyanin
MIVREKFMMIAIEIILSCIHSSTSIAGPHNVVFDEDNIPGGVDQESISMSDQIGDEGDTFEMKFDTAGEYAYYCEPHRGAGMNGVLIVA